jgi:hypothetical protein
MTSDLRIAFGESLVLPYTLQFPKTKLESCLQLWDTYNVFETPTILRQVRSKLLTGTSTVTTITAEPSIEAPVASTASTENEEETSTKALKTPVDAAASVTATAAVVDNSISQDVGSDGAEMISTLPTETEEVGVVPAAVLDIDNVHMATVTAETNESNEPVIIQEDQQNDKAPPIIPSRKRKARAKTDDNDDDVVVVEKEKDALDLLIEGKTNRSATSLPSSTTATSMTKFDFDAHTDIPMVKVHPNEFMEPCRLIATLQIARDLRNDSAVQISSLLQSLPESVRRFIAEAAEAVEEEGPTTATTTTELTDSTAREFVKIMNEQLLDMNIKEQLENVTTFLDLIQRQRKARETIHHLLIASRCQFGAHDVADTYYSIDELYNTLKQRGQILADAMDLEGFEVQPVNPAIAAMTKLEEELLPFSWFDNNKSDVVSTTVGSSKGADDNQNKDDTSPRKGLTT